MNVNILLFNDFETLDAFGPVEVLGRIEDYNLHFYSINGGTVTSRQGVKIETEQLKSAEDAGILLVPGGQGTRALVNDKEFINELASIAFKSECCLTVCTGSALLAKTGLLNGRKATTNKKAFDWVKSVNENVQWIRHARWVVDDKYYTSSGISAGIDMALGFIKDRFTTDKAYEIAGGIEYIWNHDSDNDPFSV